MIPKYAENQSSLSEASNFENAPASKESIKRPTKMTHVPRVKRKVKNPQDDENWSSIANIALGVGIGVGGVALCYLNFSADSPPIPNPFPIDPNSGPSNPGNSLLDSIVKGVGLAALAVFAIIGGSAIAGSKGSSTVNRNESTNEHASTKEKFSIKGKSSTKGKSREKSNFDFKWGFTKDWFTWPKWEKSETEKIAALMKKEDVKILKKNFLIRKKENLSPIQEPISIVFENILQFYRNPQLVTVDSIKELLEGISDHVNVNHTDEALASDLILALRVIKNLISDAQNFEVADDDFEVLDTDFDSSDGETAAAIQLSLLGDSQSVVHSAVDFSFPIHKENKWCENSENISRLEDFINKSLPSKKEIDPPYLDPESDFDLLKTAYEKRNHSIKSEHNLISKKQNGKLPNFSIKEMNLDGFFEILNTSDVKSAAHFIDKFDTSTAFPIDLWDFSVVYNEGKILYKDLEGTKILDKDAYSIISNEWIIFKKNLSNCHFNLKEMCKTNQVKRNHSLLCTCNEIIVELEKIQSKIELYKNRNELSSTEFNSLKLKPELTKKLNFELQSIERNHLLVFLGHLAVLTLNSNENREKLTKGILKLRDYINSRSSRQKAEMGPGIFGTADFIYNFCLDTLFLVKNDKQNFFYEKENSLGEKEVIVAQARNTGGHYVCDILSDQGVAVLNTSGTTKTLDNAPDPDLENPIENDNPCVGIPEYFAVSESLYNACEPFELEKVSVPHQDENNCYLSAGWLKFCVFLHYFKQTVR